MITDIHWKEVAQSLATQLRAWTESYPAQSTIQDEEALAAFEEAMEEDEDE